MGRPNSEDTERREWCKLTSIGICAATTCGRKKIRLIYIYPAVGLRDKATTYHNYSNSNNNNRRMKRPRQ